MPPAATLPFDHAFAGCLSVTQSKNAEPFQGKSHLCSSVRAPREITNLMMSPVCLCQHVSIYPALSLSLSAPKPYRGKNKSDYSGKWILVRTFYTKEAQQAFNHNTTIDQPWKKVNKGRGCKYEILQESLIKFLTCNNLLHNQTGNQGQVVSVEIARTFRLYMVASVGKCRPLERESSSCLASQASLLLLPSLDYWMGDWSKCCSRTETPELFQWQRLGMYRIKARKQTQHYSLNIHTCLEGGRDKKTQNTRGVRNYIHSTPYTLYVHSRKYLSL